jgi:hypothetical protein
MSLSNEDDELKQRLEPVRRLIEDIEKLVNKQYKLFCHKMPSI